MSREPEDASVVRHALVLSGLAFALHLVWESVQCPVFYVHGSYEVGWLGMVIAALGDVAITWTIYIVVAALSRRWRWSNGPWSWAQILTMFASALALGFAIELRAQHTGRWVYKDIMPVVPYLDVGVVPLVQLLILTPLVVVLATRFTGARGTLDEVDVARLRYDRIAPIYDLMEWMMELRFRGWRREFWKLVEGPRILELGVGTGKNLVFHPQGKEIAAIDISEGMLRHARRRAKKLGVNICLEVADAQALPFADDTFDTVVATFLFCSVPDPVKGLREARRVLKPGGRLLLLEHVVSELPVLRTLMRWFDPIPVHIWGAHIDRDTVRNVRLAGFIGIHSSNKSLDIVKLITADAPIANHADKSRS